MPVARIVMGVMVLLGALGVLVVLVVLVGGDDGGACQSVCVSGVVTGRG